jgi:hypothetical protein
MNKHWVLGLALLVTLTACSRSTQLAVQAVAEGTDGEEMARNQQVIRLLPYDRDSLFEVLATTASDPEPQPPRDLIDLRDSVAVAQEEWTTAEAAWNDMRSQMQQLSERMENMDRASNEYAQAYRRFDDLDRQVRRLDRDKQRCRGTTGLGPTRSTPCTRPGATPPSIVTARSSTACSRRGA